MAQMKAVPPGTMSRGLTPVNLPDDPNYWPPWREAPEVNWLPTVGAFGRIEPGLLMDAFATDNAIVAAAELLDRPQYKEDPNHNPLDVIKETYFEANFLDRFVGSSSEAETRDIMTRIDREIASGERLDAGGWRGYVARFASGSIDPLMLVPFSGWLRGVRTVSRGGRMAKGAAEGAIGGAVAGGAHEGIMHANQETRTGTESAFAIGFGMAVGAALGGFASVGTRAP